MGLLVLILTGGLSAFAVVSYKTTRLAEHRARATASPAPDVAAIGDEVAGRAAPRERPAEQDDLEIPTTHVPKRIAAASATSVGPGPEEGLRRAGDGGATNDPTATASRAVAPPTAPRPRSAGPSTADDWKLILPAEHTQVPKVVHFVLIRSQSDVGVPLTVTMAGFLAVRAAALAIQPQAIVVHFNAPLTGEWWERARAFVTHLHAVEVPDTFLGRPLVLNAHKVDIIRLQLLRDYGGIYLDADVVAIRPFDDLLNNQVVMGQEARGARVGLCNAVILARPFATFIHRWLAEYRSFDPAKWTDHSVILPGLLAKEHPEDITVVRFDRFFWPLWVENGLLEAYQRVDYRFEENYAFHMWTSRGEAAFLRSLDLREVALRDTAFNCLVRPLLIEFIPFRRCHVYYRAWGVRVLTANPSRFLHPGRGAPTAVSLPDDQLGLALRFSFEPSQALVLALRGGSSGVTVGAVELGDSYEETLHEIVDGAHAHLAESKETGVSFAVRDSAGAGNDDAFAWAERARLVDLESVVGAPAGALALATEPMSGLHIPLARASGLTWGNVSVSVWFRPDGVLCDAKLWQARNETTRPRAGGSALASFLYEDGQVVLELLPPRNDGYLELRVVLNAKFASDPAAADFLVLAHIAPFLCDGGWHHAALTLTLAKCAAPGWPWAHDIAQCVQPTLVVDGLRAIGRPEAAVRPNESSAYTVEQVPFFLSDGRSVRLPPFASDLPAPDYNLTDLWIGTRQQVVFNAEPTPQHRFEGLVDDVAVFRGALTEDRVGAHIFAPLGAALRVSVESGATASGADLVVEKSGPALDLPAAVRAQLPTVASGRAALMVRRAAPGSVDAAIAVTLRLQLLDPTDTAAAGFSVRNLLAYHGVHLSHPTVVLSSDGGADGVDVAYCAAGVVRVEVATTTGSTSTSSAFLGPADTPSSTNPIARVQLELRCRRPLAATFFVAFPTLATVVGIQATFAAAAPDRVPEYDRLFLDLMRVGRDAATVVANFDECKSAQQLTAQVVFPADVDAASVSRDSLAAFAAMPRLWPLSPGVDFVPGVGGVGCGVALGRRRLALDLGAGDRSPQWASRHWRSPRGLTSVQLKSFSASMWVRLRHPDGRGWWKYIACFVPSSETLAARRTEGLFLSTGGIYHSAKGARTGIYVVWRRGDQIEKEWFTHLQASVVETNAWFHLFLSVVNGEILLFVNGELAVSGAFSIGDSTPLQAVYLGGSVAVGETAGQADDSLEIDEFRLVTRGLNLPSAWVGLVDALLWPAPPDAGAHPATTHGSGTAQSSPLPTSKLTPSLPLLPLLARDVLPIVPVDRYPLVPAPNSIDWVAWASVGDVHAVCDTCTLEAENIIEVVADSLPRRHAAATSLQDAALSDEDDNWEAQGDETLVEEEEEEPDRGLGKPNVAATARQEDDIFSFTGGVEGAEMHAQGSPGRRELFALPRSTSTLAGVHSGPSEVQSPVRVVHSGRRIDGRFVKHSSHMLAVPVRLGESRFVLRGDWAIPRSTEGWYSLSSRSTLATSMVSIEVPPSSASSPAAIITIKYWCKSAGFETFNLVLGRPSLSIWWKKRCDGPAFRPRSVAADAPRRAIHAPYHVFSNWSPLPKRVLEGFASGQNRSRYVPGSVAVWPSVKATVGQVTLAQRAADGVTSPWTRNGLAASSTVGDVDSSFAVGEHNLWTTSTRSPLTALAHTPRQGILDAITQLWTTPDRARDLWLASLPSVSQSALVGSAATPSSSTCSSARVAFVTESPWPDRDTNTYAASVTRMALALARLRATCAGTITSAAVPSGSAKLNVFLVDLPSRTRTEAQVQELTALWASFGVEYVDLWVRNRVRWYMASWNVVSAFELHDWLKLQYIKGAPIDQVVSQVRRGSLHFALLARQEGLAHLHTQFVSILRAPTMRVVQGRVEFPTIFDMQNEEMERAVVLASDWVVAEESVLAWAHGRGWTLPPPHRILRERLLAGVTPLFTGPLPGYTPPVRPPAPTSAVQQFVSSSFGGARQSSTLRNGNPPDSSSRPSGTTGSASSLCAMPPTQLMGRLSNGNTPKVHLVFYAPTLDVLNGVDFFTGIIEQAFSAAVKDSIVAAKGASGTDTHSTTAASRAEWLASIGKSAFSEPHTTQNPESLLAASDVFVTFLGQNVSIHSSDATNLDSISFITSRSEKRPWPADSWEILTDMVDFWRAQNPDCDVSVPTYLLDPLASATSSAGAAADSTPSVASARTGTVRMPIRHIGDGLASVLYLRAMAKSVPTLLVFPTQTDHAPHTLQWAWAAGLPTVVSAVPSHVTAALDWALAAREATEGSLESATEEVARLTSLANALNRVRDRDARGRTSTTTSSASSSSSSTLPVHPTLHPSDLPWTESTCGFLRGVFEPNAVDMGKVTLQAISDVQAAFRERVVTGAKTCNPWAPVATLHASELGLHVWLASEAREAAATQARHYNLQGLQKVARASRASLSQLMLSPALFGTPRTHEDADVRPEARTRNVVGGTNEVIARFRNPLVSVIIATFNRERLLEQALSSVRQQTYPNIEVIVVDDGSTSSATQLYLRELEAEFAGSLWRVLHLKNGYLGAARNAGIREARGEFIVILDDDNYMRPAEVEVFLTAILNAEADVVTCVASVFKEKVTPWPDQEPDDLWLPLGTALAPTLLKNSLGDANSIFRRSAWEAVGGFTEYSGVGTEDMELFSRFQFHGFKVLTVPEPVFWYRGAVATRSGMQAARKEELGRKNKDFLRVGELFADALVPPRFHDLVLVSQSMFFDLERRGIIPPYHHVARVDE